MPKFAPAPQTSASRLEASLADAPLDTHKLVSQQRAIGGASAPHASGEKAKTVLYLAYGSNLCSETFRGARGIQPLSQINVLVPSLRLTFDLPGIPYKEPCFANTAVRSPDAQDYHKDRWHKGLVGVVYEVTLSDYAHIIATEGGGSAYDDILVDCYVLPAADTVPDAPTSQPFKAHTLFAAMTKPDGSSTTNDRLARPDPSYAQPSARYLKLITDGATECELPAEYQEYLHGIRPYTITTTKQTIGKGLFLAIWMPFLILIFTLARKLQDKEGRSPAWVSKLSSMVFAGMWMSYDSVFKPAFGDGERTIREDAGDKTTRARVAAAEYDAEKESLLEASVESMYEAQLAAQRS